MTFKQIIYNIQNLGKAGGIVDDQRLSNRQIAFWFNYYRALLVRRDLEKGRTLSDNIVQSLGCLEMEQVDSAECCTAPIGCYILRSKLQIPKPVELTNMDAITFIGTVDRSMGFELSSPVQKKWDQYNRYTSKVPKAYLDGGYIYITIDELLRVITVEGIFEDPVQAERFHTCAGEACYTEAMDYPVSAWMIPVITDMILQKELGIVLATLTDTKNDATDKTAQSQGK